MAARFGDGIRPELGATDFSGFLQGSAQGSAAIGQGIAKLGEGAGQFLGDIGQAKKDKAGAISLFTAAGNMTEDPKMKTFFESTVEKLETGTLREAAGISARAKEFMQFAGQSADRSMMKDSIFFDQKMAGKAHGLAVDKFGFLKSESGLDRAEGKEIREEQFADKRRAARDAADREAQRVKEWQKEYGLKEREVNTRDFAAQAAANAPLPVDFKNVDALRKEAAALPEFKDFKLVDASYKKVKSAAEDPTAAGDLSLIFNYMKILDPGSAVRETEFANAQNAGGVPTRIIATWNQLKSGERLTEEQRKDFVSQAEAAARSQHDQLMPAAENLRRIATERGFNPNDVIPSYYSNFSSLPSGATKSILKDSDFIQRRENYLNVDGGPGVLPPKPR